MNTATKIFDTLRSFKQPDASGITSEKRLLDYCANVLGNIERLHVDFKEKEDRRDSKLSDSDRKNLSKAVSGFANSEGGVLIWGLEDKSLSPKPIGDIQQFVSSMLNMASQFTEPIVYGIDGEILISEKDPAKGFGIVFIPASSFPPHRVTLKLVDVKDHYYVRSGESFVVAPHFQLEDMFGRRPRPVLSLSKRFIGQSIPIFRDNQGDLTVMLGITNEGRGTARAPFLSLEIASPYKIHDGIDGNGRFGLPPLIIAADARGKTFGSSGDFVIHAGTNLEVAKTIVKIPKLIPPTGKTIDNLTIKYTIAADGLQAIQGKSILTGSELIDEYNRQTV